jgi:hypothetical protein
MKIPQHSSLPRHIGNSASTPALGAKDPSKATLSVPTIVASAFGKLDLKRRAHLLGPLPVIPVSLEDAALATSSQVYELVRYVEQSNPNLIEGVLTALLQDGLTMTALGASIAAIAIKQLSDRRGSAAGSPMK